MTSRSEGTARPSEGLLVRVLRRHVDLARVDSSLCPSGRGN